MPLNEIDVLISSWIDCRGALNRKMLLEALVLECPEKPMLLLLLLLNALAFAPLVE